MAAPEPPLVTLNVGGQLFTALRATLRSRPGSLLSAMFSGEWEPTTVRDTGGHPYIDRNPAHFDTILSFMRDGTAPVPDTSAQRQALRAEATYFGCWPLVEAIDAAEERHSRMEAAREQRLLAEARISAELLALLQTANSDLESATAAANAASAEMVSLAADMAAAQEEASSAGRQLEDALLAAGERQRQRRRLHTAAVRWHALQVQHTAAGDALEAARARQRAARAAKFAAMHIIGPVRLGEEGAEADPPRRIHPRDPLPRAAPPEFDAWEAMEERRQAAAAEAAGRRGGGLGGGMFGLDRDDEDRWPWGRNGNGPAANFVADERGNAWAAPPRFGRAWRGEAAPAPAPAAPPADPAAGVGLGDGLGRLQARLAALRQRRADDDEDQAPGQLILQRMLEMDAARQERQRQAEAAQAAGQPGNGPPAAAAAEPAGGGPGERGAAVAHPAVGQVVAVAPAAGDPAAPAEPAPVLEDAGAVPEPAEPVEADEPPGLEDEEEGEEAQPPAEAQPARRPPTPYRARQGHGRREQEQQPNNRQQQLERGWGRRQPPAAKRERAQAGAGRRQAAGRGAAV